MIINHCKSTRLYPWSYAYTLKNFLSVRVATVTKLQSDKRLYLLNKIIAFLVALNSTYRRNRTRARSVLKPSMYTRYRKCMYSLNNLQYFEIN